MNGEIVFDRRLQLPGASMCTSANLLFRQSGKPSFHHVKPGSACRGEVHMITGALRQPPMDCRCLMRAVVVQDHVDVQVRCSPRTGPRDMLESREKEKGDSDERHTVQ